ncbi:MAG: hypothetical protein HFF11_00370 [Angelakisella sp.]|jgi:hypothetical protein|nr:hypothetical protein [Angelakisella sp.]
MSEDVKLSQRSEDIILEECCRQWCDLLDEAPERGTGEGFADFHRELRGQLLKDEDFMETLRFEEMREGGMTFEQSF